MLDALPVTWLQHRAFALDLGIVGILLVVKEHALLLSQSTTLNVAIITVSRADYLILEAGHLDLLILETVLKVDLRLQRGRQRGHLVTARKSSLIEGGLFDP